MDGLFHWKSPLFRDSVFRFHVSFRGKLPHFDATRKVGVPGIRGDFSSQLFVVSDPSMVKVFIDSNVHQQCRDVEQTFQIET